MADLDELYPDEDIELKRRTADELWQSGFYQTNPARWERARKEIRFEDVVRDLHGTNSLRISCPFHGRDSNPSFQIYPRTNDAHCYGCPESEKDYDAVDFTAKKLDMNRGEALVWLEKHYELPPLDDVLVEPDEDEEEAATAPEPSLSFADLRGPYLPLIVRRLQETRDAEHAQQYAAVLFEAWPERDDEAEPEEQSKRLMQMARVLGRVVVERVKAQKGMQ
jgi:hypothetical protein